MRAKSCLGGGDNGHVLVAVGGVGGRVWFFV